MRHTVSSRRSAATGGRRMLLFVALLALLYAALTTEAPYASAAGAGGCAAAVGGPAVPGPPERPCVPAAPVVASSGDGAKHPGSGLRYLCEASACHLRHHVPTGPGGKAIRESAVAETGAAAPHSASSAVVPDAAAGTPARVTVLRC
ncbi:hypothetical protein [Streptomyces lydicus]|uniref:hypothetical protein n=1 Tax=Streptomyces lydicus TaxID=47763 RepID=UPI0005267375|nr:hypothetical protein [Streptomyces lydicus]MDC7340512.1 hypothetical protein [Streptomyces lydicus]UEG89802.1 hypothetical protein LJ741_04240 [Streptomyces lydicus]